MRLAVLVSFLFNIAFTHVSVNLLVVATSYIPLRNDFKFSASATKITLDLRRPSTKRQQIKNDVHLNVGK